ncbi:MAG: AarF/ABC1/UbiB kinase family protein [Alphaproteobacteria bacterium]|nr:AarF/ABC1/UbiB kinase family protein [Alphaproteobacteria bacterium]
MARKPPTSKLGRIARLGGLTSRVGSSYLGQRISGVFQDPERRERAMRRLHIENAQKVVGTMGQLKGAAMKVGQQLAQVAEGLDLPDEVAGILSQLNDKAEPIPFDVIREDIEADLDAPVDQLFSRIEPEPLGTASLAQAHAAWLPDGTAVVVKVLHRHIEHSVASDLSALKTMFLTGRILQRDREEIETIFDEIRQRLEEELDYFNEAANLEFFRRAFRDIPGVRVPGTHPSHSGERVLTMDRLTGVPLEAFLESSDPRARQRAGLSLARMFFVSVYELGALHADPHAGNYLFEPDGTVGVLDFGCVKRFDEHWIADYARVAEHGIAGQRAPTMTLLRKMGGLNSDDPRAEQALWDLVDLMAFPFRQGRYTAGSQEDSVQDRIQQLLPRLLRYPEIRTPRNMIYLHRALGGTYAMLRRLETTADWGRMAAPYHAAAIARAEGRAP